MELKYVILLLTFVGVIFIVVEEIFQSRINLSFWKYSKDQKVHLMAHKPDAGLLKVNMPMQMPVQYSEEEFEHESVNVGDGFKNSRWKSWLLRVRGKEQSTSKSITAVKDSQSPVKNNIKTFWKLKDMRENILSEEERLKMSPYIYLEEEEIKRLSDPVEEKEVKYLSYYLSTDYEMYPKKLKHCRYKKCAHTSDPTKADMVVFSAGTIRDDDILTFQRPPGQRWLMYTIDPSVKKGYNFDNDTIKSLFNATMTYNLDADIPLLFGRLRQVEPREIEFYEKIFDGKTKMAAWFVSHCVTLSRREVYVEHMQRLMDIDIYGRCGTKTCGGGAKTRSDDAQICLPMLTNYYKFYIAFENSFCLDYVTEKFFKLFDDVQVIPVVRGGFKYKKYLPSGTYVDAGDFETPEDLARFLVQLGNDRQRYTEMLRRKDGWRLMKLPNKDCLLCEYLHSNPPNKFYPNLKDKFGRGLCWFPKKLV